MSRTDSPGSSDSARSSERIHVTMAADGISSDPGHSCSRLLTRKSR